MKHISLNKTGVDGLEQRYFKNKTFSHITGKQIKLLPFKTNPSGDVFSDDFKSFQGVIGELFRIVNTKAQVELKNKTGSYKSNLKEVIIANAVKKVETDHVAEFKTMLSKLFFDEEDGLIKFNTRTLSYMNFIHSNSALKEISRFIYDLFIKDDFDPSTLNGDDTNENLLHQLLLQCLPELSVGDEKASQSTYSNLFPELKEQFSKDFAFLSKNNSLFLQYVEDFFKFYYFQYLCQLVLSFNDFGTVSTKIKPIYFTMDWETLSESRLTSHTIGWKQLNRYSESVFAHINALELLNYISVAGSPIGDYERIVTTYDSLDLDEQTQLINCIDEVVAFYTESVTVMDTGKNWEDCDRLLALSLTTQKYDKDIHKALYGLWYKIRYQFENSQRSKPYSDYSRWFTRFGKVNFIKNRGRLGNTTILSQELLLFLTRLCIGNEDKIRLKTLWDKFRERGIVFDETTKLEITKLFEKINLIEKKSDSGDAQYVKSTI